MGGIGGQVVFKANSVNQGTYFLTKKNMLY